MTTTTFNLTTYNIPTEKDAFTSGAALIIPKDQSQTPYMTSSFDNTYTTPDLGYGEIGNSMPSEGKTNKHDINVNIVVGGTLQTLGFKPSDLINDHQLMMSLKHQLDLTSMTGKAVEGVLASSTRNSDYVA